MSLKWMWFAVVLSSFLLLGACSLPYVNRYQDPLTAEEHLKLGISYEKEGQLEAAVREYRAASVEVPEAHYFLGNLYFQQDEYDKAQRRYKTAIKELPRDPRSYNNLAWLYYTRGTNLLEAERLILQALELVRDKDAEPYQDTLDRIRALQGSESASCGGEENRAGLL
jgi:tetratricopeptide (TPR) repeat protein